MGPDNYFIFKAGRNGPAAPVLALSVCLKVKQIPFLQKQVIIKGANVIFGLVRLIVLSYSIYKKYIKRCRNTGCPYVMLTMYSVM